jgi:hypothetical protein
MTGPGPEPDVTGRLRLGLLALAALGIVGTAAELAALRHWDGPVQLVPWLALALLGTGVVLVWRRPSPGTIRAARAAGALAAAGAMYGLYEHVAENYHAGALDAVYGPKWASMRLVSRLWAAATGGVGPAPILAPAVLVQIGLCLFLASIGHPALRRAHAGPR